MIHRNNRGEGGLKETARIETFSDGVFAIAITLLVLELIQILHSGHKGDPLSSYLDHWSAFLAFFIGFCTILICWINHHHVFTYIRSVDSKIMWVNGFVLLVVTFTPFPTAILAEYFTKEGNTALAIFGGNYVMMAISSYAICAYAYNHSLIDEESRIFFRAMKRTYALSIPYTLIALGVCFISIPGAICLYVILFAVFAFPREFAERLMKKNAKSTSAKKREH